MLELIVFLFGLIIGSFLNVCIYRLPAERSIIHPPSHCSSCNTNLKPWDLVPVLSYIFLRGQCRYCQSSVSIRYPLVELLTGLIFLWCYTVLGFSSQLIGALILSSFLIVITFIDYDHQLILDKVLFWLAVVGVFINRFIGNVGILDMLYASLLGGGLLLLIAIVSRGGMGMGDVKFAAALGLWFGVQFTILTLFLSFVLGGVGSVLLLLFKLKNRKDMIPFGPYIAIGAFISMLYGDAIIRWYLQFF